GDAEEVAASLRAALRDARSWSAEYRYRRADGSYAVVLDRGHVLRDEAGRAVRMIGSMQDVTERRRLTAALEQSEAQYRRLVDNAPETIYAVDRDGRFTEANPAAVELLGRPLSDLLGRHFADVVVAEDLERTRAAFQALVTGARHEVELELRVQRPSGETRLVHIHGVVIREGSALTGAHGIARDVTDEREREQRLRRAERLASIGTMVGGVAHELNNPLAAIVGFTQLLLTDDRTPGDREDLETIQREAQRMAEIVANLRRLARDSQDPAGPREHVDLNDVVRHVVRTLTYALRTQNVEIREDLEPELPGVLGERGQIEQVVLNLAVNAEQAMRGREDSRLILRTRRTPAGACLQVVDNGPGIPQANLERIFDPFFTTKGPGEGTGLGLSLVHSIVAEHGGEIQVDSKVGAGTAFRVDFPRAPHPAHPRPANEAGAPPGTPPRSLRILVVDDEETVRRVVARYLQRRGHTVDEAAGGEAALALIGARGGGEYDAILSDLRMPGLQGTQLLARLRAKNPALERRLVFMTGDTAREEAGRIAEEAGVPVLAKPVDLKALAAALERIAG
ncbi:MAG TPA: PAS domain S-box protein, partial [Longimicrobium sp.]|nr:PAS domain S-box protein [Longimicrobium sp.]